MPTSTAMRAVFCALSVLTFSARAQISVTSTDILGLLGKSQVFRSDTTGSALVNVGAAGADQTWDFRAQTINGENLTIHYSLPQNTPFAQEFPQSNFVQSIDYTGVVMGTYYSYSTVGVNAWTQIGEVVISQGTASVDTVNESVFPLPLQFNQTWTATTSDSFGDPATFAFVVKTSAVESVDAWGTIRLPFGDMSCLRIRSNDAFITALYTSGMLSQSDTSTSITYSWITQSHGGVVGITSQDDETNPNFTKASSFVLLHSTTTAVDERQATNEMPDKFVLAQNYPNPFNPSTQITFALSTAQKVTLKVFDLVGKEVATLLQNAHKPAGVHQLTFDAATLSSGVYFYQLRAGEFVETKKMLLAR